MRATETWIDGYALPPDVEDRTEEIEQATEEAWDDADEVYAALEDYDLTTADCEALVALRLYRDCKPEDMPVTMIKKHLAVLFNSLDPVVEQYVAENME